MSVRALLFSIMPFSISQLTSQILVGCMLLCGLPVADAHLVLIHASTVSALAP